MRQRLDRDAVPKPTAPERRAARVPPALKGLSNRSLARDVIPQIAIDAIERAQRPKPVPNLSPRTVADQRPDWGTAKAKPKPLQPTKPKEYTTRSDANSWAALPDALREVLARSWGENAEGQWSVGTSDRDRAYITRIYNRMLDYDLWEHVRYVRRVKEGEKRVDLGFTQLRVAGGATDSLLFEVYDGRALRDKMLDGRTLSKDGTFTGLARRGQDSLREYTVKTRDGLHLSIGDSTQVDVHIDEISPTNPRQGIWTDVDLVKGLQHHWLELWPEYIRAGPNFLVRLPRRVLAWLEDKVRWFGIGKALRDALAFIPRHLLILAEKAVDLAGAGVCARGPGADHQVQRPDAARRHAEPARRHGPHHRQEDVPLRVRRGPARRQAQAGARGSGRGRPQGRRGGAQGRREGGSGRGPTVGDPQPGQFADAETVGQALAGALMYRARYGGPNIRIDLGPLYHAMSEPEAAQVVTQLERIGKTVRTAMASALQDGGNVEVAWKVLQVSRGLSPVGRGTKTFALR